MATPKQPAPHDDAHARPEGPWREDEKGTGAGLPRDDAGAAGEASTKGRPHDDRAKTEGAVADIAKRARGEGGPDGVTDRPPPDPDTVVVGGIGATATDPEDPKGPRNLPERRRSLRAPAAGRQDAAPCFTNRPPSARPIPPSCRR